MDLHIQPQLLHVLIYTRTKASLAGTYMNVLEVYILHQYSLVVLSHTSGGGLDLGVLRRFVVNLSHCLNLETSCKSVQECMVRQSVQARLIFHKRKLVVKSHVYLRHCRRFPMESGKRVVVSLIPQPEAKI